MGFKFGMYVLSLVILGVGLLITDIFIKKDLSNYIIIIIPILLILILGGLVITNKIESNTA